MKQGLYNSVTIAQLIRDIERKGGAVHFVGIGGVSMYSLSRLTMARGIAVTGSDREDSDRTRELELLGDAARLLEERFATVEY